MSEAIRAEAELLRQKNIAKYGPEAVARCGGSGGGRGPPGPPGPPKRFGGCASSGGKKKNKKAKKAKAGGAPSGVTKGQGVPLAGRGPNGALSRAQRRHLRRAGLSAEEIAAVVAPALAATPAAAPGPPLVGPAPAPVSGEAMDAETGGVSAPDEHQRQEEGGG